MVQLKKFRVKNYKSISDSGDCYLQDDITVLAGKNEAGKTSILEALTDFDIDKSISEEAITIKNEKDKPEIYLTFLVYREDFKEIFEVIDFPSVNIKDCEIEIVKKYPNSYSIAEDSLKALPFDFKSKLKQIEKSINKNIELLRILLNKYPNIGVGPPDETISENKDFAIQFKVFSDAAQANLPQISDESKRNEFSELLEFVKKDLEEHKNTNLIEGGFLEELKKYIPNFILFSTYEDKIPNKIALSEIEKNEFITDLAKISDLNLDLIKKQEDVFDGRKLEHKKQVNINTSKEYEKFWKQDESKLFVDWDNTNLSFWIEEEGHYYKPTQRSKGRQWHLAFYVRVTARSKDDVVNVLLIDEPGLYLHAKAQKDILNKLDEISKDMQVIFSTHSPYLIDSNKLNRVRLVLKIKDETKVKKIHAGADKETLTPILTAIGEDASLGIRVDKKNSVIVEGMSDYYYLHSFMNLLNYDGDINIIPGNGSNIPSIGAILFGWGLDPIFVLDSDNKSIAKKIMSQLGVQENQIIFISQERVAIEDIFSKNDFKKFVLDEEVSYTTSNSEYIKKAKKDKVLLSKLFLDSIDQGKIKLNVLDKETKDNFEELLKNIKSTIKSMQS
ncbi:MAG: AAA family ATPase [Candidatus Diapherotrites archaeon]